MGEIIKIEKELYDRLETYVEKITRVKCLMERLDKESKNLNEEWKEKRRESSHHYGLSGVPKMKYKLQEKMIDKGKTKLSMDELELISKIGETCYDEGEIGGESSTKDSIFRELKEIVN